MATPATLPRPGVKVIQQFQTASPTIVRASLPACVVGVAKQVVEAVQDDGSLNTDAYGASPAMTRYIFPGPAFELAGGGTGFFNISVNGGPVVGFDLTTSSGDLSADELQARIDDLALPGLVTRMVTVPSGAYKILFIQTTATGNEATLDIPAYAPLPAVLAPAAGRFAGNSGYNNDYFTVVADYPDPRGNFSQLVVEQASVRAFLDLGGGNVRELSRTSVHLRGDSDTITAFDDGDGDSRTPYLDFAAGTFATAGAAAEVQGSIDLTTLTYGALGDFDPALELFVTGSYNTAPQYAAIDSSIADETALVAWLTECIPSLSFALDGSNFLVITMPYGAGANSFLRVSGSAATVLGLAAGEVRGTPHVPVNGDELWVDGVYRGLITNVAATRLRVDTEVDLGFTGAQYSIVAKNLTDDSRGEPEMGIDHTGSLFIPPSVLRGPDGSVTAAPTVGRYIAYTALRQDVTGIAEDFTSLRYSSLTDLEAELSPIDTQNPLGLGLFFAMLNAPGLEVQGLGVDESSSTEPYGTSDSWARAFEFLENMDVYGIAPLSHNTTMSQIAAAHVDVLSGEEYGLERVVFYNPVRPTRSANTLVASGALGNAVASTFTFDTGIANLPALLAAAGVGLGPYTVADDLHLEVEDRTFRYLITSVAGSVVTITTTATGTDGYYDNSGASPWTSSIVDTPFSIAVRGSALANRTEEAIAYQAIPQSLLNRRMVVTVPDRAKANIDGLETLIEGFYMNAALVGKTSSLSPQLPLTNVGLAGFTGVQGSNDRYSEYQMTILDGGGCWVMVQDAPGTSIYTRHQLTSDMTSIEKREFSILKAVDFVAKTVRASLRNFIGRFNITTNVINAVSTMMEGLKRFFLDAGVLADFNVNSIRQSETAPDNLLLDVTLGILYPLNEIRVTLII